MSYRIREFFIATAIISFGASALVSITISALSALHKSPGGSLAETIFIFVGGIPLIFLLSLVGTLPAAIPVALFVLTRKTWSLGNAFEVALIAMIAGMLTSALLDPASARGGGTWTEYILGLSWLFMAVSIIGILSGTLSSLVALFVILRCRRHRLNPSEPGAVGNEGPHGAD